MNCEKILFEANKLLKINNISNPNLDSELILSEVLKTNREKILIDLEKKITKRQINKFNSLISRRIKKEPVAYILGYKHFWKSKFFINKSVLIPRPETELIVEESINCVPKGKSRNILDIGTGSGCIIISVLKERPQCSAKAIDISSDAIKIAKTNAKLHHLENKINFINIDVDKFKSSKYDLIISNPPYISSLKLKRLGDDIKLYEPKLALNGGLDGYKKLKQIIIQSSKLLKKNGKLVIEIGYDQKNNIIEILKENGFYVNKICQDLSGKDRCIISTKNI